MAVNGKSKYSIDHAGLRINILFWFRFWEDQSDEFKDTEGSLLPLWRFSLSEDGAQDLEVTGLSENDIRLSIKDGIILSKLIFV